MFAICPFEIVDRKKKWTAGKEEMHELFQIKEKMLIFEFKAPKP